MEKLKNFVKNHKEVVIGSIMVVGGVIVGKAIYQTGVKHGVYKGTVAWVAMLNADADEVFILRDHCLSDIGENTDTMKEFVKYGHHMLNSVKKGVGL